MYICLYLYREIYTWTRVNATRPRAVYKARHNNNDNNTDVIIIMVITIIMMMMMIVTLKMIKEKRQIRYKRKTVIQIVTLIIATTHCTNNQRKALGELGRRFRERVRAHLVCTAPMLTDDPERESRKGCIEVQVVKIQTCIYKYVFDNDLKL